MKEQQQIQKILVQLQEQLRLLEAKKNVSVDEINNLRKRIEFFQKKSRNDSDETGSENETTLQPELKNEERVKLKISSTGYGRKRRVSKQAIKNRNIITGFFIIMGLASIFYSAFLVMQYFSGESESNPLFQILFAYIINFGLYFTLQKIGKNNVQIKTASVILGLLGMYLIAFLAYSEFRILSIHSALAIIGTLTNCLIIYSLVRKNDVHTFIGLTSLYIFSFHITQYGGNTLLFFLCLTCINIISSSIALIKKWKQSFYVFAGISWLMTILWLIENYILNTELATIFNYSAINFVILHLTHIIFRFSEKRKSLSTEVFLIVLNSFIFYILGIIILFLTSKEEFAGMFTLSNLALHLIIGLWVIILKKRHIYLIRIATGKVFVLLAISFLIYIPLILAIVTLFLIGVMFLWYGRKAKIRFYEIFSVPFIFLPAVIYFATNSRIHDIMLVEIPVILQIPFLNMNFFSNILILVILGFILKIIRNPHLTSTFTRPAWLSAVLRKGIYILTLIILFFTIFVEIDNILNLVYSESVISMFDTFDPEGKLYPDKFLLIRKFIWYSNYTVFVQCLISIFLQRKIKRQHVAKPLLFINALSIFLFIIFSHFSLKEIWSEYLISRSSGLNNQIFDFFLLRYISYFLIAYLLFICNRYVHRHFMGKIFITVYDIIFHIVLIWIFSSELIQWLMYFGFEWADTFWVSILFMIFSLYLYFISYFKQKNYLLYFAYLLCIFTGMKLLFYDFKYMDSLTKTILFSVLGILFILFSIKPGLKIRKTNY